MTIKSDIWIKSKGVIEPCSAFTNTTMARCPYSSLLDEEVNIISYGLSSYGYDVRCSNEFKIFTNINSTVIDPKNFDNGSFVNFTGEVCIIPPNSFVLTQTVEYFRIPRNILGICMGKST